MPISKTILFHVNTIYYQVDTECLKPKHNMLTRQEFDRHWAPLLTIYRLFTVYFHSSSSSGSKSCCSRLWVAFYRLFSLGVCVHLVFVSLFIFINIIGDTTIGLGSFLKRQVYWGELLVYLVTFIESIWTVRLQGKLMDQIFEMQNILHRLNVDFDMKLFCRKWLWIICRTILIVVLIIIASMSYFNESVDLVLVFGTPTMMGQMRLLQIAAFVDFVAEMLNGLLVLVEREKKISLMWMDGEGDVLRKCMDIYSKLLNMAGTISRTFGWSLLPILGLKICEWTFTWYLSMLNTEKRSLELHVCTITSKCIYSIILSLL